MKTTDIIPTVPYNVLGVDPGQKGAACLLSKGNPIDGFLLPFKSLESEFLVKRRFGKAIDIEKLYAFIKALRASPDIVVLETPLSLPGISNQSIATSFAAWGMLYAAFKALQIPLVLVNPSDWVLPIHDRFCDDSGLPDNKKKSLEVYKKLWPRIPVQSLGFKETNDGFVDAALLGFFVAWKRGWLAKYKQ